MADLKLTEKRFTLLHVGIIATICVVATAAFIVIIQYVKSQPVTSSPIKVRGGAMTARTSIGKNGGWVSNGCGYCTNVDITQFSTDAAPVSSAPAPANPTSLLADWPVVGPRRTRLGFQRFWILNKREYNAILDRCCPRLERPRPCQSHIPPG